MNEQTETTPVVEGTSNPDAEANPNSETKPGQQTNGDIKSEAQRIADAMVAKKLKNMPSKEEMAAFKAWQESQKTEEQKQSDALINAQNALKDAEEKAAKAEARAAGLMKGIQPDYVDDAVVLATQLTNEEVDIDHALDKIVEKYPMFKSQASPVPAITTGVPSKGASLSSDEAYRQKKYGNNPYYKKGK